MHVIILVQESFTISLRGMNGKMTNAVILIDMQQMYIDYLYDTKSKLIPSARTIIKAQKSVIKECIKYPFD